MSTPSQNHTHLRVLLTGSTGFIGQTIAGALRQAGHIVHTGCSPRSQRQHSEAGSVPMDFARDTTPKVWLPRLQGIDVVINAVGVLRDSTSRPIDAVHTHTPKALFDACAQAGIGRVVHISALGVAQGNTRYATTKRAADEHLLGLAQVPPKLSAVVLRPSIVFGKGGASSALFMNLAQLPIALLPGPVLDAKVQPVSVHDLAQAVVALLGSQNSTTGVVECTGPQALTMGELIASLREQQGRKPAKFVRMPQVLTQLSARMGDMVPSVPWCTESLTMLGSDNVGDCAAFRALLGRDAVHYSQLVATAWK